MRSLLPATTSPWYPWTTKGYASLARTEGGAYEGDWYGTLGITKAGQTATLRNERPYDGTPDTTYFDKVHLILTDLLGSQRIGRALEVPRVKRHLLDVRPLGVLAEVANAHVFEHPLA